jgi:O-antigen/teichoic acid export membrane protein
MERATRHGALVIGAFIITSFVNYAFGVGLSWLLEPADYGMLGVAQALLLLSALIVSAGFNWTANHDIAAAGVNDHTRIRFRTAWLANVTLGSLLALSVYITYRLGLLDLGPAYRVVVPLVGVTTVILAARAVVNGAAQGLYRFGPVAYNQLLEVAVKFIAGLALVASGWGVAGVMAAFALGSVAALIHSFSVVRPAHFWQGSGWLDPQVLILTAPLFLGMLGPALMLNLDILGLRLLAPPGRGDELAGFYQAAVILARFPVLITHSLIIVLFSYVAGARLRSHPPNYRRAALRLWQRLLLPAGMALVLAPRAALTIFFPSAYQVAAPALRLAAIGGILLSLATLLAGIAQAGGQRKAPAFAMTTAILAQVITLVWLAPHWESLGAAASLIAAGVVALLGMLPWSAPQIMPSPILWLRRLWPLFALAPPLILLPGNTRWTALLQYTLAGLAYLLALLVRHPSPANPRTPAGSRFHTRWFKRFVHVLIGD